MSGKRKATGDESNQTDEEDFDDNQLQQQQQQQLMDPEYEEYLRSKNEASMERMRAVLERMTPEELNRYETYRSAAFPKPVMRKLVGQILNQNCSEKMAIVIAGAAKLFVGDLVEAGKYL
jgi:transcription initiation factor TFIID subunit 11